MVLDSKEKDHHLGSTRAVVGADGAATEGYEYYPFGKIHRRHSGGITTDEKFTGKELDNDNDERIYYFGARYYDSDLGRWTSVDPLASKYPGWSPYNYSRCDPVNKYDPDGRQPWDIKNKKFLNDGYEAVQLLLETFKSVLRGETAEIPITDRPTARDAHDLSYKGGGMTNGNNLFNVGLVVKFKLLNATKVNFLQGQIDLTQLNKKLHFGGIHTIGKTEDGIQIVAMFLNTSEGRSVRMLMTEEDALKFYAENKKKDEKDKNESKKKD